MRAELPPPGWPWQDALDPPLHGPDIADVYRSCFAGPAGRLVLDHLRKLFLLRRVAPSASDAELRHVEGQRSVVAWLFAMAGSSDACDLRINGPATERTAS